MNVGEAMAMDNPYEHLQDLRRQRLKLFERTSAMTLRSVEECRDLTGSERLEYDASMLEYASLGPQIEEAERELHAASVG
jgi:hypothetical protein